MVTILPVTQQDVGSNLAGVTKDFSLQGHKVMFTELDVLSGRLIAEITSPARDPPDYDKQSPRTLQKTVYRKAQEGKSEP